MLFSIRPTDRGISPEICQSQSERYEYHLKFQHGARKKIVLFQTHAWSSACCLFVVRVLAQEAVASERKSVLPSAQAQLLQAAKGRTEKGLVLVPRILFWTGPCWPDALEQGTHQLGLCVLIMRGYLRHLILNNSFETKDSSLRFSSHLFLDVSLLLASEKHLLHTMQV